LKKGRTERIKETLRARLHAATISPATRAGPQEKKRVEKHGEQRRQREDDLSAMSPLLELSPSVIQKTKKTKIGPLTESTRELTVIHFGEIWLGRPKREEQHAAEEGGVK